ncbi:hypothetical protein D3C74_471520 [compost metagenome]
MQLIGEFILVPDAEQFQIQPAGLQLIFQGMLRLGMNIAFEQHGQAVDHLAHIRRSLGYRAHADDLQCVIEEMRIDPCLER